MLFRYSGIIPREWSRIVSESTGLSGTGRVDRKVRVIVQDGSASVDVISGALVTPDNASFEINGTDGEADNYEIEVVW
jgi:hypothetical protein